MSQFDFGTIDPNSKSGPQLALDLNKFRDALNSGHRGSTRPAYSQAGMQWVRETSSTQWDLMFFDGDTDFVLRSINPTTNQLLQIPSSQISGLGTAATANLTTSSIDTTAGRILKVGDLGVGAVNSPHITNLDSPPGSGFFGVSSGATGGPNGVVSGGDTFLYMSWDANAAGMMYFDVQTGRTFTRNKFGLWSGWLEQYNTGNVGEFMQTLLPSATKEIAQAALGVAIKKEFVSGELTITASGLISIPHSLGARPKFITAEAVCKIASLGWSVGDVVGIAVSPFVSDTNITRGIQVAYDPVNVIAKIAASALAIMNKTSGAITGINASDWRLVLRAYV